MVEREFQKLLIKELKERYPNCLVLKTDPRYIQGIPDLIILFDDKWATLEVKKDRRSNIQPNQVYYVDKLDSMSFSAFIYPDNKEEVLNDMERTLRLKRQTRIFRS